MAAVATALSAGAVFLAALAAMIPTTSSRTKEATAALQVARVFGSRERAGPALGAVHELAPARESPKPPPRARILRAACLIEMRAPARPRSARAFSVSRAIAR